MMNRLSEDALFARAAFLCIPRECLNHPIRWKTYEIDANTIGIRAIGHNAGMMYGHRVCSQDWWLVANGVFEVPVGVDTDDSAVKRFCDLAEDLCRTLYRRITERAEELCIRLVPVDYVPRLSNGCQYGEDI